MNRHLARGLGSAALVSVLLVTSCVDGDAPTDPSRAGATHAAQIAVAPQFAGTGGQALSAAAAQEAFDRLTCFELVAVRVSNGEVVAEETYNVSPGQDRYALSAEVDLERSPERFRVTITAYASANGDPCGFELFSGTSEVSVDGNGLTDGTESEPTSLTLSPSGPQLGASELLLEPGYAVLSGGGTVELVPTLLDDAGNVILE